MRLFNVLFRHMYDIWYSTLTSERPFTVCWSHGFIFMNNLPRKKQKVWALRSILAQCLGAYRWKFGTVKDELKLTFICFRGNAFWFKSFFRLSKFILWSLRAELIMKPEEGLELDAHKAQSTLCMYDKLIFTFSVFKLSSAKLALMTSPEAQPLTARMKK